MERAPMNSLIPEVPSNVDIKENERIFQQALDNYWHTDTTKHSDKYYSDQLETIWLCVYTACTCICKSIYKQRGVIVEDLDEVVMDATEYTMRFLLGENKGHKLYVPKKLGTFCFLRCRYVIDAPKRKWEDTHVMEWLKDDKGNYLPIEDLERYERCEEEF